MGGGAGGRGRETIGKSGFIRSDQSAIHYIFVKCSYSLFQWKKGENYTLKAPRRKRCNNIKSHDKRSECALTQWLLFAVKMLHDA